LGEGKWSVREERGSWVVVGGLSSTALPGGAKGGRGNWTNGDMRIQRKEGGVRKTNKKPNQRTREGGEGNSSEDPLKGGTKQVEHNKTFFDWERWGGKKGSKFQSSPEWEL